MDLAVNVESIESLQRKVKSLEKEVTRLKNQVSNDSTADMDDPFEVIKTAPYIAFMIDDTNRIVKSNDKANDFFAPLIPEPIDSFLNFELNTLFSSDSLFQNLLCKAFDGNKANSEICIEERQDLQKWLQCYFTPIGNKSSGKIDKVSVVACDITDRKRDEDTLKQSEAWLNQIYGDAPIMIYAIDEQAIVRQANKKWLEQTGYSRDEVIGKKIKVFLTDESKESVYGSVIPEFMIRGKVQNKEAQLIKKNGELMDVRFSAVKSSDTSGRLLALTVVEDVSEILRAKDALIETDEQYRKLVEGLPDIVLVTDISGNIKYASPNIAKLNSEAINGKIIGSNLLSWIDPKFHDEYLENSQQLIDGEQTVIGVYDFLSLEDDLLCIEMRTSQLNNAHGMPRGFINILRDITEERKAQETLKFNEQILQQISENSADIIWMMDKHNHITFVSKAAENILGYSTEEAKTLSLDILQSSKDLERKLQAHRKKFPLKRSKGEKFDPVHLEVQHIHKNGSKVWTEMRSSPLYNKEDEFCGLIGIIRDISERKATELAIRESQELYRSLIELSPEGIIIINHGKIEFANREFIRMLKVEREKQIVERNFLDLVKLKDHANVRKWLKRVEQFKSDNEVILAELDRFDGEPLFAEVMATPITIRGEKSAQLFVRDVTQRILTSKELSKERELNENLIKSIPDFIYFKDTAGKFIKINRAFSKALGLEKPEDAVGKSDIDFFGIKHFRRTQKEEKEIIHTKKPLIGAIREEPWSNESIRWVSVTKMPLYGPDREVVGTYGVSRNITKQKQAEEELRRREERFRHLFGQVQVGMALINPNFEILDVNNALCSILKYRRKEILSENILNLLDKSEVNKLKEHIQEISVDKTDHYHSECKLFTNGGEEVHVILKIIKLGSEGDLKDQLLCQVVDINDRKVAEEQLLIRNNELNNFVYKVSHDLRAPLLSVKGLINLLRLEGNQETQAKYVGMIEERVEKLDGFIRDILSHSKNLNTNIEIGEVNLKEIAENCFSQMHYHQNAKKVSKSVVVKGVKLYSDQQRLKEVLRNLISNAIIYTSTERINSFVRVNVKCGLNLCTIIVEDNGIGIKKAYLDKIFRMFYRANDRVEGSGIGLYIVQQSVNKLGGEVHVESKLNSGTKFTLTIPNNSPQEYLT